MPYKLDELYHHGRLGQRWGVKNGPPYPLSSQTVRSEYKGKSGLLAKRRERKESEKRARNVSDFYKEASKQVHKNDTKSEAAESNKSTGDSAASKTGKQYNGANGKPIVVFKDGKVTSTSFTTKETLEAMKDLKLEYNIDDFKGSEDLVYKRVLERVLSSVEYVEDAGPFLEDLRADVTDIINGKQPSRFNDYDLMDISKK